MRSSIKKLVYIYTFLLHCSKVFPIIRKINNFPLFAWSDKENESTCIFINDLTEDV